MNAPANHAPTMTEHALLWREDDDDDDDCTRGDAIVDMSFRIDCAALPVDHAWHLQRALERALPWLRDEPRAAIHRIFGAASGNGWARQPDGMMQLSKRTRLRLRLPQQRAADARALRGRVLDIAGHDLAVGDGMVKPLTPSATLFARSVAHNDAADEAAFARAVVADLDRIGIRAPKLLCGLLHVIARGGASLAARSVLLAGLDRRQSLRLQQHGLGAALKIGCGIFVPHKSIAAVRVGAPHPPS